MASHPLKFQAEILKGAWCLLTLHPLFIYLSRNVLNKIKTSDLIPLTDGAVYHIRFNFISLTAFFPLIDQWETLSLLIWRWCH